MKTDYSILPAGKPYDIFRNSDFSKVVEDKLSAFSLKGGRKCKVMFNPVTDTPDAVSLTCQDLDTKTLCKGTPEAGTHLLTRRAYEDFNSNRPNSENVKRDLKRIEEFLYQVKLGTK